MKYVSGLRFLTALMFSVMLGACAFNDKKDWSYDGSASAKLMPTENYLPVQEKSEDGIALPYTPKPNPYEELSGRIDRETIDHYISARRAFQTAQYDVADQLLTELTASQPNLSGPFVMRGDVAVAKKNLEQAVEFYMAAIRINPINFNAYLRLAKSQRLRGHFTHAQNTYARALNRWPDGAELHLNLGVLYDIYLNQPLQAQAHMEAYQFLSGDNSGDVVAWLDEIRQRTGVQSVLKASSGNDGEIATVDNSENSARDLAARSPRPENSQLDNSRQNYSKQDKE